MLVDGIPIEKFIITAFISLTIWFSLGWLFNRHLFDEWFDGAHNAMVDVEATTRSFVELVKRDVIQLETNSVMRLF